jgi:hypothetical protein
MQRTRTSHRGRPRVGPCTSAIILTLFLLAGTGSPSSAATREMTLHLTPITALDGSQLRSWAPRRLTDHGYGLARKSSSPEATTVAWGPDVGTVHGATIAWPSGGSGAWDYAVINDHGVVAGNRLWTGASDDQPFVVDLHDRIPVMLDNGGFERSIIEDLGDDGTIVGALYHEPEYLEPWITQGAAWVGPAHTLVLLPDLGFGSEVLAVNARGDALGWMRDAEGALHPTTWDTTYGGPPTDLTPLTGGTGTAWGYQINERGDRLVRLRGPIVEGAFRDYDVVLEHGTNNLVDVDDAPGTQFAGPARLNESGQIEFTRVRGTSNQQSTTFVIIDIASGSRREITAPDLALTDDLFNDLGQIGTTRVERDGQGVRTIAMLWDPVEGWRDLVDPGEAGLTLTAMNSTGGFAGTYSTTESPWVGKVRVASISEPDPPPRAAGDTVEVATPVAARPAFAG